MLKTEMGRRGGSASVAIVVAIAFAVSWNPLVKLNTNAVATVRITSPSTTHSYHRASGRTIPNVHPNRVIAARHGCDHHERGFAHSGWALRSHP